MRALGPVVCGLLLAACTSSVSGEPRPVPSRPPQPGSLTAAAALGEFRTVDFCTLLDAGDGRRLSSFELCGAEVDFVEWTVGPLSSGAGADREAYDYPHDLPPGVRVHRYSRTEVTGCVLLVGFADDVWLTATAADAGEPPWSSLDAYCGIAEDVVAGALAAIEDGRVGHTSYGPDSFGGIDPCPLVTGPAFEAIGGGSQPPSGSPSGHECVNGRIGLSFSVGPASGGTPETVGGRPAVVRQDIETCDVYFQRPLPNGLTEKATVSVLNGGGQECAFARAAAELVAPKLPQ